MISCEKVNLNDPQKGKLVIELLDSYASDIMGGGESLSEFTKSNLIRG
jgi:hypothetical protein